MGANKTKFSIKSGKNVVSGTREFVSNVAWQTNMPFRYSESKNEFVNVTEMHDKHLLNTAKSEMNLVDSVNDLNQWANGPVVSELKNRGLDI